jgi:alpha,alpha-trehalose phosphorylase
VLKQADVVLALFLQGAEFTPAEKRRNFEYYDALTTGDSTLSAVVQSIIAAEVGHHRLARSYFLSSLFVDLADLHHNTADGVHVASTGGIWSALVSGFGGMRDHDGRITFNPRLPEDWEKLVFRMTIKGSRVRVTVEQESITFTIEEGEGVTVHVGHEKYDVARSTPVVVPLSDQGPRIETPPPTTSDLRGMLRADGSVVTASIPMISIDRTEVEVDVQA